MQNEIRKLSSTDTQATTYTYFRSPLSIERTESVLLNDDGCQEGQMVQGSSCTYQCNGFVSNENVCIEKLGKHMHVEAGRFAMCDSSAEYDATSENCHCTDGTVESRDGSTCVDTCGENERLVSGRCTCVEGAFVSAERCTLLSECGKVAEYNDGHQECLDIETCKEIDLK